jgi:hypothetical protein
MKELKPVWQTEQSSSMQPLGSARLSTAALSLEELGLIDAFLQRRSDLDWEVRSRMAGQILERLRPKLTAAARDQASTESLLEALAYECRSTGIYS